MVLNEAVYEFQYEKRGLILGTAGFRLNASAKTKATAYVGTEAREIALLGNDAEPSFSVHVIDGKSAFVNDRGALARIATSPEGGHTGQASAADGAILSPMPGKVIAVDVAAGDSVTAGQRLMVLEAMKMEHALTAPFDGTVAELNASEGGQVQVEAVLAIIEPIGTD